MSRARAAAIWALVGAAATVPIVAAALSPLLQWREPVYIAAGLAGVLALALLLFQPLLAAGYLPGLSSLQARLIHRGVGAAIVLSVIFHVAGLWYTSPPDVIDALLFVSATPFSNWGVIAMWSVFASAFLVACRRRLSLRPRLWRVFHKSLAVVIVAGSVVHALLIEGTMELVSKIALCALVVIAMVVAMAARR